MRLLTIFLLPAFLFTITGCSQVVILPRDQLRNADRLEDVTIRTRTGEIYFFERATVGADSLNGLALESRTVFLESGEVQEVSIDRRVHVALDDVEQLSQKRRDWTRTGLWIVGTVALAGVLALIVASDDDPIPPGPPSGGGGKPPPM